MSLFYISVPFISSEPIFSKDTYGFFSGKIDLNKATPFQKNQLNSFHHIQYLHLDLKQHSFLLAWP